MKKSELIKALEQFPDDAQICIYDDCHPVAPLQTVCAVVAGDVVEDGVSVGDVVLSAYS